MNRRPIHPLLSLTLDMLHRAPSNPTRKKRLRSDVRKYQGHDTLACKLQLQRLIQSEQVDGRVAVYHWGRDCDQYESDGATTIPATVVAYEKWEASIYDNAEGPTRTEVMSFDEYRSFTSTHRDRRAEQYNY